MQVVEVRVGAWNEFVQNVSAFETGSPLLPTFLFRGQARAEWPLSPSLLRYGDLNEEQALDIEKVAMKAFETQAHLYVPPRMAFFEQDLFARWAIMQHYGVPTRLLDWTASPFVAAYFAVEKEFDFDGAVWIVHVHSVQQAMKHTFGERADVPLNDHARFLDPKAEPLLLFAELGIHTDRMNAQQTKFTFSTQVLANHGQVIETALTGGQQSFQFAKAVIPAALKYDFMRHLRTMNITGRALFPGIDGLGRSVAEFVRLGAWYKTTYEKPPT